MNSKVEEAAKRLGENKTPLNKSKPSVKNLLGGAAISLTRTISIPEYVLNGEGMDGWFRRTEGTGKGYGLMVREIKVTSRKNDLDQISVPIHQRYKVSIKYETSTGELDSSKGWVWVHKDYSLDEVIKYINKNKSKWVP